MASETEEANNDANAELDAAISLKANSTSFAEVLGAAGVTTVLMGDDDELILRHPDGRTEPLSERPD